MKHSQNKSFLYPLSAPSGHSSHYGTVWLVGAGCHDARWLSLEAADLLKRCEAVVYDDLVDPGIVALAVQAKKYYRGKRGHKQSADQQEIHALLQDLASHYACVVRLKGGDPMIFGRGMEEIEQLAAHHIPVRVVPGISSFYGIAAKEGFGLTKRGEAAGFMVLSAHRAGAPRSKKEWQEIAGFSGTIVFLMGMREIEDIARCLIQAGLDPKTPAAVLSSPAMTMTESLRAPLESLAEAAMKAGLKSPGIILIGGTVQSFHPQKRISIALYGSQPWASRMESLLPASMQSVRAAWIAYDDFDVDLHALQEAKAGWLVFTSPHGASRFLKLLQDQHLDLRLLGNWRIACIGTGTADVFYQVGLFADLIADPPCSESLLDALSRQKKPEETLFLFQSAQALPVLQNGLKSLSGVYSLYDFSFVEGWSGSSDYACFPSSSAARFWLDHFQRHPAKCLVAGSRRIAAVLEKSPQLAAMPCAPRILIAPSPSAEDFLACIEQDQAQPTGR